MKHNLLIDSHYSIVDFGNRMLGPYCVRNWDQFAVGWGNAELVVRRAAFTNARVSY